MTAIDPVCQMEVEEAEAAAVSIYQGTSFYFCAVGCKEAFDLEPERYLGAAVAAAKGPSVSHTVDPGATRTGHTVDSGATRASIDISVPVDVAIRTRRSITRFRPDAVSRDALEKMLEATVWAPNHHLTEPWEFFVLTGDSRRRFAEIRRAFRRTLLKDPEAPEFQKLIEKVYSDTLATPAIILVTTTNPSDPDLRDDDYAATMCAIQNMMLVAVGLGLGTYLRTGGLIHFPPLREFLGIPETRRVAGVVYVGYPAHVPERRRTPAPQKTHWLD